jgi:hypothetical protein
LKYCILYLFSSFSSFQGGQGVNQRQKIIKEVLEQKKIEVTEIGKKVFGLGI